MKSSRALQVKYTLYVSYHSRMRDHVFIEINFLHSLQLKEYTNFSSETNKPSALIFIEIVLNFLETVISYLKKP